MCEILHKLSTVTSYVPFQKKQLCTLFTHIECILVQCSAVQCSAVQCSAVGGREGEATMDRPAVLNSSPRAPPLYIFFMSLLVNTPDSDNQLVRSALHE